MVANSFTCGLLQCSLNIKFSVVLSVDSLFEIKITNQHRPVVFFSLGFLGRLQNGVVGVGESSPPFRSIGH